MRESVVTYSRPGEPADFGPVERQQARELAAHFRKKKIDITVPALRKRFRRCTRFEEVFEDASFGPELIRELQAVREELVMLWNYTPRADLQGRRPAELVFEQMHAPRRRKQRPRRMRSFEELRFVEIGRTFGVTFER